MMAILRSISVVILGGGFGGGLAAIMLEHQHKYFDVTLIDNKVTPY